MSDKISKEEKKDFVDFMEQYYRSKEDKHEKFKTSLLYSIFQFVTKKK